MIYHAHGLHASPKNTNLAGDEQYAKPTASDKHKAYITKFAQHCISSRDDCTIETTVPAAARYAGIHPRDSPNRAIRMSTLEKSRSSRVCTS
jgi:hypothetical protein